MEQKEPYHNYKVIKNKKTGKLVSLSELLDKWKEAYEKMKWEKEVRERVQKDIEDAQENSNQKD